MSDVSKAEDFLRNYGPGYETLLGSVQKVCEAVQATMGIGVIDDIYDRKKAANSRDNFKSAAKIVTKVRKQGKPATVASFLALNDVVGLTVVVRYPAPVKKVISEIREALARIGIETDEPEPHEDKNGYFATHITCLENKAGTTRRCEIQIKTMLHNAWSAKMHDLTYKPAGVLDPRLKALMGSVAVTIESLEQQSQLIHDLIKANWNVEEKTRRKARDQLFEVMLQYHADVWNTSPDSELARLRKDVERVYELPTDKPLGDAVASGTSNDTPPSSDASVRPTVRQLSGRIDKLCETQENLRFGWMIAARLTSLKPDADLVLFFMKYADQWLEQAPPLLKKETIEERELRAVPLAFYVIGDLDKAIDYADRLVTEDRFGLSPESKARLKFNRATFLVEREYHAPTEHPPSRATLQTEIENILNSPDVQGLSSQSAILDTSGLKKITFAETAQQVHDGIKDCLKARALASASEEGVSDAYVDLNLRLGWRRYFHLEATVGPG